MQLLSVSNQGRHRFGGVLPFFLFVMVLPLSVNAWSASINFFGLGGLGQFNKNVVSMREGRYTDLVEQRFDFSCGAAAVTTVLKYAYNQNVSELDVIEGMLKVSDEEVVKEKGFSLLDVRRYVETLGLRGRGYNVSASTLAEIRIPTIVLLDIRGYKHFVVLRRVLGNSVYVGDPALGNRVMPFEDFDKAWNGVIFAVVGKGFDRDTVLSTPKEALTARKFLYDHAPITNSELLDFGFSHADLF